MSEENNMGARAIADQGNFYDDLDQFELKDDDVKDIGVISKNSLI